MVDAVFFPQYLLAAHSFELADVAVSKAALLACCAQADAGAQAVQIFDSWASELSPQDFDVFAGPYIKQIIASVRQVRAQKIVEGGLLEQA